jgi:hypothetical protein
MPDDLEKLARRVAELERALKVVIAQTGTSGAVDAAERAHDEEAAARHQENVDKLSALSNPRRR